MGEATARRCELHNLALSPRGDCVVCRRKAQGVQPVQAPVPVYSSPPTPSKFPLLLVAILFVGVGGWTLYEQRTLSAGPNHDMQTPAVALQPGAPAPRAEQERRRSADPAAVTTVVKPPPIQAAPEATAPTFEQPLPLEQPAAQQVAAKQAARDKGPSKEDLRLSRRQVGIKLYTTSWCPACRKATAYLRSEGISFIEYDIDRDSAAEARMKRLNPKGSIPTFDIDGIAMTGWSPEGLQANINYAALKRWQRNQGNF